MSRNLRKQVVSSAIDSVTTAFPDEFPSMPFDVLNNAVENAAGVSYVEFDWPKTTTTESAGEILTEGTVSIVVDEAQAA